MEVIRPPTRVFRKPTDIDFDFDWLTRLEGGQILRGYIPRYGKKSGVTIATGIDLGQVTRYEFRDIVKDEALCEKLYPYMCKTGDSAFEFLLKNPLDITKYEAKKLDKAYKMHFAEFIARLYDVSSLPKRYKGVLEFVDLPLEAKTVALSVAWNCGKNLAGNSPMFWGYFCMNDWISCQRELWNFYPRKVASDGLVKRRRAEAQRLIPLTGGALHIAPPTVWNPLAAAKFKMYR